MKTRHAILRVQEPLGGAQQEAWGCLSYTIRVMGKASKLSRAFTHYKSIINIFLLQNMASPSLNLNQLHGGLS